MHRRILILFISTILIIFISAFFNVLATYEENNIKAAGANIRIISENAKNIYAAGVRLTIEGKAKQDIWAAGALIDIDTETNGNLYAAGSRLSVKGKVSGNARLAGAELKVDAEVGEQLSAAAASIEISKNAVLPNDTSLAAALIEFNGVAKDNLSLYADQVIFSGHTSGPVTIEGRHVQLGDTAHIEGNLTIRSSEEAVISPNAIVAGKLTKTSLEDSDYIKENEHDSDSRALLILLAISVFLLGLILVIFARGFVEQCITLLRTHPGQSILWGFVVFISVPIFIVVTTATIIGIPIGVATLLLLPFLFILGITTAAFAVSDWILNKNVESKKTGQRIFLLATGVILLVIIGFVPFLGEILILLVMLLGLGAASVTLGNRLRGDYV